MFDFLKAVKNVVRKTLDCRRVEMKAHYFFD